jgi:hypothetical protein
MDIFQEYCKATEWDLATLEELYGVKKPPTMRVNRQQKICQEMVMVVHEEMRNRNLSRDSISPQLGRLRGILGFADLTGGGIQAAVLRFMKNVRESI